MKPEIKEQLEEKYSEKLVQYINHYKKFEVSDRDMKINMEVLISGLIKEVLDSK